MYLGIDIGGTKTLVASLSNDGVIQEKVRFATPQDYSVFLVLLEKYVDDLTINDLIACGVAVPGKLDRAHGIGLAMGNLPWKDVPIAEDVKHIVECPTVVENDANLAGLSEAMLLKDRYNRVLYVTISTGIGTGVIVNQEIAPGFIDSEGGQVMVESAGRLLPWEKLISGQAIVKRFGKRAQDITDRETWSIIAHDIGLGLIDLIAMMQPQIIVLGGGVDTYFDRFSGFLAKDLKRYETPIVAIPPIIAAARPDDAVVYGCYDLAKMRYGKIYS